MAIMCLSREGFTCPMVRVSLFLSVLGQFTLTKKVWDHAGVGSLVDGVDPDQLASEEVS